MVCCSFTKNEKQIAGIKRDRCPTDIPWLLLYFFAWGGLLLLWGEAEAAGGDPAKILSGVDMYGRICGVSKGVENLTLAAWPHAGHFDPKICVETCNETLNPDSTQMAMLYESVPYFGYCLPQLLNSSGSSVSVDININSNFMDGHDMVVRGIGDIFISRNFILASAAIAVVMVFIWISLLRYFAGYVVWISSATIIIILIYGGYHVFTWASGVDNGLSTERATAVKVIGGLLVTVGFILLLVIFFLRTQIKISIEVVKEAARAIMDMKAIVFVPLLPAGIGVAYFMFWIYTGLFVWSVSNLVEETTPIEVREYDPVFFPLRVFMGDTINDNPETMQRYVHNQDWEKASFYHLFHMLWTVQFLIYFGYLVFAGAAADWYFTTSKDDEGRKRRGSEPGMLSKWPILASCKRTMLYHLGTVALCSLIIAIIQMLRIIIKYIEKNTQGNPPNKVQKAIFAAIQCCLKCVECCLDKLNRNALIWTAIWGDGFCTAACSAFVLLWRNLHRVAAINLVSTIILTISKFVICSFTAFTVWSMLIYGPLAEDISTPVGPAGVSWFLAWLVGSLFLNVFNAIIDAIFLCFLVDFETNPHGNMVASDHLQKLVGKYEKESKDKAEKEVATRAKRPKVGDNKVAVAEVDDEEEALKSPSPVIEEKKRGWV